MNNDSMNTKNEINKSKLKLKNKIRNTYYNYNNNSFQAYSW